MSEPKEFWNDLKLVAQAATKGPWIIDSAGTLVAPKETTVVRESVKIVAELEDTWISEEDRTFIAAANPKAVLELIEEIEGLRTLYKHIGVRNE